MFDLLPHVPAVEKGEFRIPFGETRPVGYLSPLFRP
ncbi:hypothetical protein B23_0044 [Geobacillus thermoleovorans B23]|nr:hypothetical protein B23_0044 [Geobacillus thermoleovorans B23]